MPDQQRYTITLVLANVKQQSSSSLEEFVRAECGLLLRSSGDQLLIKGFLPGQQQVDSKRLRIDDRLLDINGAGLQLRDALRPAGEFVCVDEQRGCVVTLGLSRPAAVAPPLPPPPPHFDLGANCAVLVGEEQRHRVSNVEQLGDTHGLLLLRTDVASDADVGEFADVLFAFPPREQSRLCSVRGSLLVLHHMWPAFSYAAAACRSMVLEDSDGEEVTVALCQPAPNQPLLCGMAAPSNWLAGIDLPHLLHQLLDLLSLLGFDLAASPPADDCQQLSQLLQVLFCALAERRFPDAMRRLLWPACALPAAQAQEAQRLLQAFDSCRLSQRLDFSAHAHSLGCSLSFRGLRIASTMRQQLSSACWLYQMLHRHFTAPQQQRQRLTVAWAPVQLRRLAATSERQQQLLPAHLTCRPAHILCCSSAGLSLCVLYCGLTNLSDIPQTLLDACEGLLAAASRLTSLHDAAVSALATVAAGEQLRPVEASGGGGGGLLSWFRSRSSRRSRASGSRAGSLKRAGSTASLDRGMDRMQASANAVPEQQQQRVSHLGRDQQQQQQQQQQQLSVPVLAYLSCDWSAGVCHLSGGRSDSLSAAVSKEFLRLAADVRPQLLRLAAGDAKQAAELSLAVEFHVELPEAECAQLLPIVLQARKAAQHEMYFCLCEPVPNLADLCQELTDLLTR